MKLILNIAERITQLIMLPGIKMYNFVLLYQIYYKLNVLLRKINVNSKLIGLQIIDDFNAN